MPKPLEELKKIRLEKLKKIRKLGIDPYPARCLRKQTIAQALKMMAKNVAVTGRIMAVRGHGGIQFFDLRDESAQIQLVFRKNQLLAIHHKLLALLDIGDFIDVQGKVFKTKAGETSILVKDFHLLTKSIRPLPSKWYGLKDIEERYRKRYLDLLLNPKVRERFDIRSKLIRAIQDYLDKQGYIEVETPVLQSLYGGTNARPFKTHINAFKKDMYLRIADELYLKRLVVGGYEKVYEICKDFRNEGIDLSHNPEFTMIEFYEAYADYHRIMEVTESLVKFCAKKLFGEEKLKIKGKTIDLSGAWPKIEMTKVIKRELGLDVQKLTQKELVKYCRKNEIETRGNESKGELTYTIFDHQVPSKLIKPTWVIDYPVEVSPLCKRHPKKEGWVERFEGYIGGEEICDGWSEINDPLEQRERFEAERKAMRAGKKDAHPLDEDFITALEYGMPTLGGIGIGVDRLTMFFTDTWSIKEVILFPLLRPKRKKK